MSTEANAVLQELGENLRPVLAPILGYGRAAGADFVEIFLERRRHWAVEVEDGRVTSVDPYVGVGAGVRVFAGPRDAYVSTNDVSASGLRRALDQCLSIAGVDPLAAGRQTPEVSLGVLNDFAARKGKEGYLANVPSFAETAGHLKGICERISTRVPHRQSATCASRREWQEVLVAASDGTFAHDIRLNDYNHFWALCVDGAHRAEVSRTRGGSGTPRFLWEIDADRIVAEMEESAGHMLRAQFVESGQYPIIMGNCFGGVIFHEACGHLLETTQLQRKTSPFAEKKGQRIAHEAVTAWDEGVWNGAYGSLDMDDEGMPSQKTLLIENGVLRNFIADRMGSIRCGLPRTGSGRRQNASYASASRMRNTYLGMGPWTPEQLLASVERGLYCKHMAGGSVGATGDFNFAVQEAWLIENGKLTRPLKGATIVGTAQEILMKISMCANDLDLAPGHCGSVSGRAFTTVGQPHIKVDHVTIGGR